MVLTLIVFWRIRPDELAGDRARDKARAEGS
jgi:hypothetical protein